MNRTFQSTYHFRNRIALLVLLAFGYSHSQAQKTVDLTFTDGLQTKLKIDDDPRQVTQGCIMINPFVFGAIGGPIEQGAYGPFSAGIGYSRFNKSRSQSWEGYLTVTPLDSRREDGEFVKKTPYRSLRLNHRLVFARTESVKMTKINFETDAEADANRGSKNTAIHRAELELVRGKWYCTRLGLEGQMSAQADQHSWSMTSDPEETWYRVERRLSAFGHIGISRLKVMSLIYESKDFGGRFQSGQVGEIYADFLFGLANQGYGLRYFGDPNEPQSEFGPIPEFKKREMQVLRFGGRIGFERRANFIRSRAGGSLIGLELGASPGFFDYNFYLQFKFGWILMGKLAPPTK